MKNIENIYNVNFFGSTNLPNVVLLDKNLTNNEKLALALFMSFQKNSEVFPAHRKAVAELMNLSMSQMNKIAGDLVEKGYLIRNDRMQKSDQNRPIVVHLFVLKEHWFHLSRKNESLKSLLRIKDNIYLCNQPSVDYEKHTPSSTLKSDINCHGDVEPEAMKNNSLKKPLLRETKWHRWAKDVIEYWNKSGCRRHLNTATQTYKDALRDTILVLKGRHGNLDGSYSTKQIKYAIDNFAQAATDKDFLPQNKDPLKRCSLSEFYYNEYVKEKVLRSSLMFYTKNPPKPIHPLPKEKNQKLTNALMEVYTKHKLNNHPVVFSRVDKIKFIEGANRLHDFFTKNTKAVDTTMMRTNKERAEVFWQAIAEFGKEKINPNWFASDISMRRFVEYATENGYLQNYSLRL